VTVNENDPTRWEIMDEWLDHWQETEGGSPFTCPGLAHSLGITNPEATQLIQAQMLEQSRFDSRARYVIERRGRTRSAVWTIGVKKKNMQQVNRTYFDDIEVKARRTLRPTLRRIAELNPQLAKEVEQVLDGALDGAFMVMKAALRV
jgi:hypothetical protein